MCAMPKPDEAFAARVSHVGLSVTVAGLRLVITIVRVSPLDGM